MRLAPLAYKFVAISVISVILGAINALAHRAPLETHAAPHASTRPKFLERSPPKLRAADLYAVESQDHYLRVHTSAGCDLILMRLIDAIGELDGVEGAQTHRSWWVARSAVVEARRSDGRATLLLASGAKAPVSRTYARALKEAGWL